MGRIPLLLVMLAACQRGSEERPRAGDDDGADASDPPAPVPCVAPSLQAPASNDGADVAVRLGRPARLGDAHPLTMRRVVVDGTGEGTVEVSTDGPFVLFDADGTLLEAPLVVSAEELPRTLLLSALRQGAGALTVTPTTGDTCAPVTRGLVATDPARMAGRTLSVLPGFQFSRLFRHDEQVQVAIDPADLPDRVGQSADLWIVRHLEPAERAADPSLVDVAGGPRRITLGPTLDDNTFVAWDADLVVAPGEIATSYDLVLDFGGDGRVDPDDLIEGLEGAAFSVVGDLSAPGPYTPGRSRINDGRWLQQELWIPEELTSFDGPLPLVVISHGNGHDYTWYGHLGAHLSSWGFLVMSHSNNTEPGIQTASQSTLDNTDHLLSAQASILGGRLDGWIDRARIGWIGHSRGGEGVARAYDKLWRGQYTPASFGLDDVRVVSSIAPTVFQGVRGQRASLPHDVTYHLLAGGADGDVTGGADCAICQFLRIPATAEGDLSIDYLHGASHNVFHDGGGWDDGIGPARLTREQVHPAMKSIYLALMGWKLMGLDTLREALTWHPDVLRLPGIGDDLVLSRVWRDAQGPDVLVLDDFSDDDPSTNALGGAISTDALEAQEVLLDDGNSSFSWTPQDPANGMTWVSGDGEDRGLVLAWSADQSYTTLLPEGRRAVHDRDVLALRLAQTTRHPAVRPEGVVLEVELEDEHGTTARLSTAPWTAVHAPYARGGLGGGTGWANEFNTVELPLRGFVRAAPTLDLRRVVAVRLLLGPSHGSETGRVGVDDLRFVRRP